MMIGTILNPAGILVGGVLGLSRRKPLTTSTEAFFKVGLGAFATFYGLRLTWMSFSGSMWHVFAELLSAILSLSLGKLTGQLLGLQRMSNVLGKAARARIEAASPADPFRAGEGFKTCTALFCAAPLGVLGAIELGLAPDYAYPLAIKAVMDGLAMVGLARLFGWGTMLSAFPVLALQGSIALVCVRWLTLFLETHGLANAVSAVIGLLVFSVALVILGLKKIELADYLPSLIFAPLLTCLWRHSF